MTTLAADTPFSTKLAAFARDIKLSHSLFAMPFALLAMTLAAHRTPGGLRVLHVTLVALCMVTARTVAMAANRLLDARIDAANARTARRAIPSGTLSVRFVLGTLVACAAGFVAAAAGFYIAFGNPWPVILALPVLAYLCAYPLMKRFTRLCHYYLGVALALAPVCAWVAVRGTVDAPPLIMALAVMAWTAGFDIVYACQDHAADVAGGLHSVPAKLGVARALWVARGTHVVAAGAFVWLGASTPEFGPLYAAGAGIAIVLLAYQHAIVRAGDLSRVNVAFFTVNGVISLVLGTLGMIDVGR